MQIEILGTGFPAMIVTHAITIYCKSTDKPAPKIVMYGSSNPPQKVGARFYEREIPMMPGEKIKSRTVSTESKGEIEDYIEKLGGPLTAYNRPRPEFLAFDYHQTYAQLWEKYAGHISPLFMSVEDVNKSSWDGVDFVFNTLPRPAFFGRREAQLFAASRHWRLDESEANADFAYSGVKSGDQNFIIFDGSTEASWYRITNIFGLMSIEWQHEKRPPIQDVLPEILPLGVPKEMGLLDTYPTWRENTVLTHVGPLARWRPCTDIAEVYFDTMKVLRGDY